MKMKSILLTAILSFTLTSTLFLQPNTAFSISEQSPKFDRIVYSPLGAYSYPWEAPNQTRDQIYEDLEIVNQYTDKIRLYTVDGSLKTIIDIANELDMKVAIGIDLTSDYKENQQKILDIIDVVNTYPSTIDRVIVGENEIHDNTLDLSQLIEYIKDVRNKVPSNIQVTTITYPKSWEEYPTLAEHSDLIMFDGFYYWRDHNPDLAVTSVMNEVNKIRQIFPDKQISVEVGYPTSGSVDNAATYENQQKYFELFQGHANTIGLEYTVFEAFDEPWKLAFTQYNKEEEVHFGVFTEFRETKNTSTENNPVFSSEILVSSAIRAVIHTPSLAEKFENTVIELVENPTIIPQKINDEFQKNPYNIIAIATMISLLIVFGSGTVPKLKQKILIKLGKELECKEKRFKKIVVRVK